VSTAEDRVSEDGPARSDAPEATDEAPGDAGPAPADDEVLAALEVSDAQGRGGSGPFDAEGRVRLSFTRIDTLEQCARRFRYAYVDRLPTPPSPALSFGSSVHAVLEWLHGRKVPSVPEDEELLAALYERWDQRGFAEVPREEQLRYYGQAKDLLLHHRDGLRATGIRPPAGVEAWFELEFDDAVVVGSIDRVDVDDEGRLHVIDYKTNRRAKSRRDVARSLQLAIYALACEDLYGHLPATVTLQFVAAGGVSVTVPVEEVDVAGVPARVAAAAARVRAGDDRPTPNNLCGWCDFRAICPAWEGEGPEVLGPAVAELERLRRSIVRDAARLRSLEDAVERLGASSEG